MNKREAGAQPMGAGLPSLLLALGLLPALGGCTTASSGAVAGGRAGVPAQPRPNAHGTLFRTLQAALQDHDEPLARRLIADLRARPLEPDEVAWLDSCEQVLVGRELVSTLTLLLESEPVLDEPGRRKLFLSARSEATRDVRLRLPPADLKRLRTSMDARGVEGMNYESRASSALEDLLLVPTVTRRLELLTYELPLGRALAVRERWRLQARAGQIEAGGQHYPAADVVVRGCEHERLSPLLPAEAATPAALARLLAREPAPSRRALLELTLRLPREQHGEALAALSPVVERLARTAPERIERAEPALRWLTRNRDIGPDAAGWSRYLARASSQVPLGEDAPSDGLDLPTPREQAR